MTTLLDLSVWYKARQDRVNAGAARLAQNAWGAFDPANVASWGKSIPGMVRMVQAGMTASATGATEYVSASLRMQNVAPTPDAVVAPEAFAQAAADGRPLGSLLYLPALTVQSRIDAGATATESFTAGLADLQMIVGTEVADAGRQAVGAGMTADRRVIGYYRQPGSAACARCAILAGMWSSTAEGAAFERHPKCQCTAVPAPERGKGNPVAKSPSEHFDGLSTAQQNATYGKANAQAIREGADPAAVINARRGLSTPGFNWTTTEGTTKRGFYRGHTVAGKSGEARMTVAGIYRVAADREEAVALLAKYGYLV